MDPILIPSGRVFICSPYGADPIRGRRIAQDLCRLALERGWAPFAPHLLYPRFLDDTKPSGRELGLRAGLQFLETCEVMWVYLGEQMEISPGMALEMEFASKHGVPIKFIYDADLPENE